MTELAIIDLQDTYDYIIFDCGYIDRLVKKKDEIVKKIAEGRQDDGDDLLPSLIFFVETSTTGLKRVKVANDPDNVYAALKELELDLGIRGAVCFRDVPIDTSYLEIIGEYRHCGFFGPESEPSLVARFETSTGKRVLFRQFDTESG